MNSIQIIGRITKDPEIRYNQQGTAVGQFSVAIDRGKDKDGNDRGADYPNVTCFGKTAELVEKWCYKGQLVGVTGRLQTGSYEKDGKKVYTTDVVADRVEFLSRRERPQQQEQIPEGFSQLTDEDIPF